MGKGFATRYWMFVVVFLQPLLLMFPTQGQTHEMRPAVLDLVEEGDATNGKRTTATLRWKARNSRDVPEVQFPEVCAAEQLAAADGLRQWRAHCGADVLAAQARLALPPSIPDAVVRIHTGDGVQTMAVDRSSTNLGSLERAAPGFLVLGIEHILLGPDHLLFVLGLMGILLLRDSGSGGVRRLVLALSSFTVAHSITLALSVTEVLTLPERGVEAAIAASLVLLGVELTSERESLGKQHPYVIAFLFGLLHGFGFAGALRSIGLPATGIALPLLNFNIGVELGQLAFVGALTLLATLFRPLRQPRLVGYAVGVMGCFWLFERVVLIFSAMKTG